MKNCLYIKAVRELLRCFIRVELEFLVREWC